MKQSITAREAAPTSALRPSGAEAGSAASLPDVNEQTHPYELVQLALNQAAAINGYVLPDPHRAIEPIRLAGGAGVTGYRVAGAIHRFLVRSSNLTFQSGIRSSNLIGEAVGTVTLRWLPIPEAFVARPGREPPPTELDASRSQRFVTTDVEVRFGEGETGFHGFGTGRTFPLVIAGKTELHATCVGTILEGFGKLRGHQGVWEASGFLEPDEGLFLNLVSRIPDPGGNLQVQSVPQLHDRRPSPDRSITFITFIGHKNESVPTTYSFGAGGEVQGLNVTQHLRAVNLEFDSGGPLGLRASRQVGPIVGSMTGSVRFNPFAPGAPGTNAAPVPFTSPAERYTFFDPEHEPIGGFFANIMEARQFNTGLPGFQGLPTFLFGGFGPIYQGTGEFEGVEGLLSFVSGGTVFPHVLSNLYILGLVDPEGRFREERDRS